MGTWRYYGDLLRRSWTLLVQSRALWLLGFLNAACLKVSLILSDVATPPPDPARADDAALLVCGSAALTLIAILISFLFDLGLIRMIDQLNRAEQPPSVNAALRVGWARSRPLAALYHPHRLIVNSVLVAAARPTCGSPLSRQPAAAAAAQRVFHPGHVCDRAGESGGAACRADRLAPGVGDPWARAVGRLTGCRSECGEQSAHAPGGPGLRGARAAHDLARRPRHLAGGSAVVRAHRADRYPVLHPDVHYLDRVSIETSAPCRSGVVDGPKNNPPPAWSNPIPSASATKLAPLANFRSYLA